jgi:hypothetical protein
LDASAYKAEILRCGKDPHYFINTYVRIQHPVRGLIPFRTFDYQDQLISDYVNHRFNIILKARQLGISEITAAYACWLMLFHRNKNILVMATKADTAKNIIKKIRVAMHRIPEWLRISDIIGDNKLSVELSNGSQCKAISSSDDAGRSEALSLLIIDEAAHVPNLEELWVGLLPTVSTGGNIIVLSTPNGVGNKFHQLWTESESGENEFHRTKLMWWVHPERIADLVDDTERPSPHEGIPFFKLSTWYKAELKKTNMSPREVAQELECNFNASGDTFLSPEQIQDLHASSIPPVATHHWDRALHEWWAPRPKARYFITADVARGDGKDFSTFDVWDIENMDQCAEYHGKLPVEEFAKLLMDTGHRYNNALLCVENNNIGMACLEHIRLGAYENVYYSKKGGDEGEAVHAQWGPASKDMVIGFTMSQKLRPLVFTKLEEFLRNRAIRLHSKRLAQEAETFIWENGKPQAMKGYNDDLFVAAALGCWIKDVFISPGELLADLDKVLLSNMRVFGHTNDEIVGATKNPDIQPQRQMGVFTTSNSKPLKLDIPGGKQIDLRWLY